MYRRSFVRICKVFFATFCHSSSCSILWSHPVELSKLSEEEPRAASVKVTSDTAKAPGFADVRIMFGLCGDWIRSTRKMWEDDWRYQKQILNFTVSSRSCRWIVGPSNGYLAAKSGTHDHYPSLPFNISYEHSRLRSFLQFDSTVQHLLSWGCLDRCVSCCWKRQWNTRERNSKWNSLCQSET